MNNAIIVYYIGLMVFALNGLQFLALRRKAEELRQAEDRLRRLMMRVKLRRVK